MTRARRTPYRFRFSRALFEKGLHAALAEIPDTIMDGVENVEFIIDDRPPKLKAKNFLLGLYQGVPLNERGLFYQSALPDTITLYRANIESVCRTGKDLARVIRETVIHEIAHYFGMNEREIRTRGFG